jgi:hypothetical protein
MLSNPKATKAVRNEASGLANGGAWLLDTVIELAKLKAKSKDEHLKIVMGQLMAICFRKIR